MKPLLMFVVCLVVVSMDKASPLLAAPVGPLGITAVSYRGTGCPSGSVGSDLASDGQAMTLVFSQFGVDTSTRGGWPMRKACNVELTIRSQVGWQYSLVGVDLRGYANLEPGVIGVQKVAYSFGRQGKRAVDRLRLVGPYDDNFANHADIDLMDREWSPCSRRAPLSRLFLRVIVNVRPQRGFSDDDWEFDGSRRGEVFPSGYMTVDSLDGAIVHRYQIAYRRC
jgi:hypothetical protein